MNLSDYAVVLSTCGSRLEAETIAGQLVSDKTAACVNIVEGMTLEWSRFG